MERDLSAEIDSLKAEINDMKARLAPIHLSAVPRHTPPENQVIISQDGQKHLDSLLDELVKFTSTNQESGAIAHAGTFISGDGQSSQQSIWTSVLPAENLLHLNDSHMVEIVLSSIGNSQRLSILLALLRKPLSVAQMVDILGAKTTGQIYHHLKPLVAANLIKEENGAYHVVPYRVQGIMLLLTGVWDLLDNRYHQGNWEDSHSPTPPD